MNKIKKFFFNKIEKGKTTNFSDLINSFLFGGLKILIFFMLNAIVGRLSFLNRLESEYGYILSTLSVLITFSILIYILVNRIPNQFSVIKNYIATNTVKKVFVKEDKLDTSNFKSTYLINDNSRSKMSLSKTEKRTIIVLMLINCFALFVNYFGLSYRFGKVADLFTNSNGINGNYTHYPYEVGYRVNSSYFYPIVDFTSNNYPEGFFFKGIFAYYDTTEFLVYTLLIFGIVLIRKIW